MRRCSPAVCWRVSTKSSRWQATPPRRRCPRRSMPTPSGHVEAIGGGFMSTARRESKKPPRDLRLPGSVAEIMASPPGPEIGAFFDLDGTLVAGFTARHPHPGTVAAPRHGRRRADQHGHRRLEPSTRAYRIRRADRQGLGALRGRILSDLEEIGERLFVQRIESRIYPEMRELVRAHLARGHTVVLSSSALTIQVAPVARSSAS